MTLLHGDSVPEHGATKPHLCRSGRHGRLKVIAHAGREHGGLWRATSKFLPVSGQPAKSGQWVTWMRRYAHQPTQAKAWGRQDRFAEPR